MHYMKDLNFNDRRQGSKMQSNDYETRSLGRGDLADVLKLEEEVYTKDELCQGKRLMDDIENRNGYDYSIVLIAKRNNGRKELLGYAIGVEDQTDKGESCIYLEDIAVSRKVRGRGLGWLILKKVIEKIKVKLNKDGKLLPISMHLRESSKRLMDKHKEDLEILGLKLIHEAIGPEYYSKNEDALYRIYKIENKQNASS